MYTHRNLELRKNHMLRNKPYRYTPIEQNGSGIGSYFKEKHLQKLKSRPRKVDKFMQTQGKQRIKKIEICRTPVSSKIQSMLKLFSGKDIDAIKKQYDYDDLFHLYMIMHFANGQRYLIEKNEVVRIEKNPKVKKNATCKTKNVNAIFNNVIVKSEQQYSNLYYYSANEDNCQKFIKTLANNMGVREFDSFIMQYHVKDILTGKTRKASNFVTTLAASFKRYLLGAGNEEQPAIDQE